MALTAAKTMVGLRTGALAAGQALGTSIKGQAPVLGCVALYIALTTAVFELLPVDPAQSLEAIAVSFVVSTIPVLLFSLFIARFINLALYVRPKHPIVALAKDMKDYLTSPPRLVLGVPMVAGLIFFIRSYSSIKYNIPNIAPYSWDAAFIEADRWLHFGRQPWEWLQPLLGYPFVTLILNVLYNLWFVVMWMFWMGLAFQTRPDALRTRFFLSFVVVWGLGGSAMALLLPAAGPCYYSLLGYSPDPFTPLLAYLREANEVFPIWALGTQDMLWQAYTGEQHFYGGISAMPSMHNASTLLFALTSWRLNRRLGLLMFAYTFVIFLGSIHLAWHYAVDAYIGWALTLAVWWGAGRFADWFHRTSWAKDLDETSRVLIDDRQPTAAS